MRIRTSSKSSRSGLAILVVIALVALVFVFMAGNARTLHHLSRNVKFVEEKQKRQFAPPAPATPERVPATNQPSSRTNSPPVRPSQP